MFIASWIIAYVLVGVLLVITLVYVGFLAFKAYSIRQDIKRAHSYRYILRTPSEDFKISSATDGSPSPKLLEASVRPPTQPPYFGKNS